MTAPSPQTCPAPANQLHAGAPPQRRRSCSLLGCPSSAPCLGPPCRSRTDPTDPQKPPSSFPKPPRPSSALCSSRHSPKSRSFRGLDSPSFRFKSEGGFRDPRGSQAASSDPLQLRWPLGWPVWPQQGLMPPRQGLDPPQHGPAATTTVPQGAPSFHGPTQGQRRPTQPQRPAERRGPPHRSPTPWQLRRQPSIFPNYTRRNSQSKKLQQLMPQRESPRNGIFHHVPLCLRFSP